MTTTTSRCGKGGRARMVRGAWLVALTALASLPGTRSAAQEGPRGGLETLTLEELMDLEVTTATRSPERAMTVPAAVHVITSEDIRRSGASSLAELLRLAPGVQVARIDAGKWAIGIRGFADRLARSMLVLVDGRAVYSPLFAGTYWETQHVVLEDIERIEVVRGPGGTLWGSNAVNGIINVVMKPARETQGALLSVAAGTEDRFQGTARYGGSLGERSFLRGYVSGFDRESQHNTGALDYDAWRIVQTGLRLDSEVGTESHLTVQGDAYAARLGEVLRVTSLSPPFLDLLADVRPLRGANLLARFEGAIDDRSDFQIQSYFDRTEREEYPVSIIRRTFDVDFQLRQFIGSRHHVVWGAGYRLKSMDIATPPTTSLPGGSEALVSGFAQDEISFASNRVRLILGVKLEHNRYSGFEVQPSARALWLVNATNAWWASVTRAVRRPSRVERRFATTSVLDPAEPSFIRLLANPDFRPEKLLAYEAGYRVRPSERTYFTLSLFYNRWNDLLSTELLEPFQETMPPPPRTIVPVTFRNGIDGRTYGLEATADVHPRPWWRVAGTYALLRADMTPDPGSTDITQESRYEGGSPRHQVQIRNAFDLPEDISFDWGMRYVSELPDVEIPAYVTSDIRVAWRFGDGLEAVAVGRNLHEPHHPEWPGDNGGADVEIQRSLYVGVTWRH